MASRDEQSDDEPQKALFLTTSVMGGRLVFMRCLPRVRRRPISPTADKDDEWAGAPENGRQGHDVALQSPRERKR